MARESSDDLIKVKQEVRDDDEDEDEDVDDNDDV